MLSRIKSYLPKSGFFFSSLDKPNSEKSNLEELIFDGIIDPAFREVKNEVISVLRGYSFLKDKLGGSYEVVQDLESLDAVEIVMDLEDKFKIEIPDYYLVNLWEVNPSGLVSLRIKSLVDYIAARVS